MSSEDIQARKMKLAEKNVLLGRQRLYAAIFQVTLTGINLIISLIILAHAVLGGH